MKDNQWHECYEPAEITISTLLMYQSSVSKYNNLVTRYGKYTTTIHVEVTPLINSKLRVTEYAGYE